MPYELIIYEKFERTDDNLYEFVLGSATFLDLYWESPADKLNLPIISSLTENADSESDFSLIDNQILSFNNELKKLLEYWSESHDGIAAPESLLQRLEHISSAIEKHIHENIKITIL